MKNFAITTDRNDTIQFENIFNDTQNQYVKSYSLKRGNQEFVNLGALQIFNYDCYTTEKYVPGKKIMCTYTASSCLGYRWENVHIMVECYSLQTVKNIQARADTKLISSPRVTIKYFCTVCVKSNGPIRQ